MMKVSCFYLLAAASFFLSSAGALRPMNGDGGGFQGAVRELHESEDDENLETSGDFEEESDCQAPGSMERFKGVIGACKFAAPTSKDQIDNDLLGSHCSKYFKMQDGYMRFMTDNERAELRIPNNDEVNGEGFSLPDSETSLKATLRLATPSIGENEDYTWMQLHGESTPYIRMAHYGKKILSGQDADAYNYMWLFIKTGSSSSSTKAQSIPMGPVPDGDFDASIVLKSGKVTIKADDFSQTFDIEWSDSVNYFKAGVYVQDGNPSDFLVDYKSLEYSPPTGSSDGSSEDAEGPSEDESEDEDESEGPSDDD